MMSLEIIYWLQNQETRWMIYARPEPGVVISILMITFHKPLAYLAHQLLIMHSALQQATGDEILTSQDEPSPV
jgi:hypothetical protein